VLVIRKEQYDSFLQTDKKRFVELILQHIIETMPDEIRGIPTYLVCDMIETAIKRARSHELNSDEQIMAYVSVMFEIAPNFDEEPTLQAILTDENLKPEKRWDKLFSDSDKINKAWEQAAQPNFYDKNAWIS